VATIRLGGPHKLGPKFFRPYEVLERIGPVAYRLQLPKHARIHIAFLKKFEGIPLAVRPPLPLTVRGRAVPQPDSVVRT
jgi:hypothetical protein